ncbi:unnamed protein product [Eruca vesicaria subsp. sativa]|uniref:Membrane-associated kinase regulator 5 n=1 Tax=Eruca vesicaria subsp. sativa TaxID=29727 RepID=A0ABC8JP22_ERUVS|nr:unnamed protein product [Eruca vesicaria subsp. sativa]
MEALTFMKFWLTNNKPRRETRISESAVGSSPALEDSEFELCDGDDSFFELEISLSDFSLKKNKTHDEKQTTFSVSKSKVIPFVETTSKPQSPTTPLNSGRKFRAFSFKKQETAATSFRKTTPISKSLLKTDTMFLDDSVSPVSSVSSSKRFFDLIKPLYKTTKKQSVNSVTTSPASSPTTAREKQRNNKPSGLWKSRSASATVGVMSPAKRVDESLQMQQDGIQSAILHCKKSFHGSESYLLPRSSSESSSLEKLSTSSSEDSYLFSRLSSESMSSEKSFDNLTSIKEQMEKISD